MLQFHFFSVATWTGPMWDLQRIFESSSRIQQHEPTTPSADQSPNLSSNNDRRNGEERGACVDPPPATSMAVHGSGRRMQRSADPLPASTTHPRWRSRGRLADCRHRREVLAPLLPPVCPCHVEMSEVEITPVTTHPPASAARHGRAGSRYGGCERATRDNRVKRGADVHARS